MIQLEQLKCLHSENTPTAPWYPILSIDVSSLFIPSQNYAVWGHKYKSLNLTKTETYAKSQTYYYICIKFASSSIKTGLGNVKKVKITN